MGKRLFIPPPAGFRVTELENRAFTGHREETLHSVQSDKKGDSE